jgi:hypothetical protein
MPDQLLETLAALEHEQWIAWTRGVISLHGSEIPSELKHHWRKLWVPYEELDEPQKDVDREFAKKVIDVISEPWSFGTLIMIGQYILDRHYSADVFIGSPPDYDLADVGVDYVALLRKVLERVREVQGK